MGRPLPTSLLANEGRRYGSWIPMAAMRVRRRCRRVSRFDWYLDSGRVIYTRNGADGRIEIVATRLDTGEERVLLKANATELSVAPDGNSVAYNSADGHFSMNRYV